MIFLASELGHNQQPLLGAMNMTVDRNAFGRQIDSFEANLSITGLDEPFHAVFIRAPVATAVGDDVDILSQLEKERIVAAKQGHLLATAFHPELTNDNRLHQYFLQIIAAYSSGEN
jgi:5'-phosphate synthase pdxT subunit